MLESRPSEIRVDDASGAAHSIRQEIKGVLVFVAAIWAVALIDWATPWNPLGLVPRQAIGLLGIGSMTFLHLDFSHLISNTFPLVILLVLLAGSRARSWSIVVLIVLCGGLLLWIFGRQASHKGASLLIFGLISFLISTGLFYERRPIPALIAVLVTFFYGIPLVTGVLPRLWGDDSVSWDGHLCGAIAGVLVAWQLTRRRTTAVPATQPSSIS